MNTLDKKSRTNQPNALVQASEQEGAWHPLPDAIADSTPRLVIRGESFTPHTKTPTYAAITDWVDFSFPLEDSQSEINRFFRSLVEIIGDDFSSLTSRGKGIHGWLRSYSFKNTSAIFAIGGQNGRAFLRFPGTSCALLHLDVWPSLIEFIRDKYSGRIIRWDGAADDYEGVHNLEWALEQYKAGGFKTGGNRPKVDTQGDWINNEGRGRTLYFGARKNGKYLRIYEKGNQLGDPLSPWVRWELELKRKDRDIPWEVLLQPGQYVAGAYPCMTWIHEKASRIRTFKKTEKISYDYLTGYLKQAYGKHLNVMLEKEGSLEKVFEKISRPGLPTRLDIPIPPELTKEG